MKSDWIFKGQLMHVLAALTLPNQLALEVSIATGLRIGDVLALQTEKLKLSKNRKITIKEEKTGKSRRVTIPVDLYSRLMASAGRLFVFEHRLDWKSHRTRQAVWKDLNRAAGLFRIKANLSPHSARKTWSVEQFHKSKDIEKIRKMLNHSSPAVTALYALADTLMDRNKGKPSKSGQRGL